jgi:hypothetical protein
MAKSVKVFSFTGINRVVNGTDQKERDVGQSVGGTTQESEVGSGP